MPRPMRQLLVQTLAEASVRKILIDGAEQYEDDEHHDERPKDATACYRWRSEDDDSSRDVARCDDG